GMVRAMDAAGFGNCTNTYECVAVCPAGIPGSVMAKMYREYAPPGPADKRGAMNIKLKRVYEKPSRTDGTRILVDRLWPRGLTKERAAVDLWLKEIAPSTELRKWFDHDPAKWTEFRRRYRAEVKNHSDELRLIKSKVREGRVTLLYGARDQEHNEAVVLQEILER
ncbi:MAG: DUF488 family protein, N3 subclade, partial [Bryobacteraceae bacterium]